MFLITAMPLESNDKGKYTYKVSKGAKIRNRYNQVPHLTQDTNGKVNQFIACYTNSLFILSTNIAYNVYITKNDTDNHYDPGV